jgi:hypothetical protein
MSLFLVNYQTTVRQEIGLEIMRTEDEEAGTPLYGWFWSEGSNRVFANHLVIPKPSSNPTLQTASSD